ncbi:MAG TPA: outer membrane lipoprotein carrier protein LolA [Thermoanaerobaculia bacterium]|nr:outer membrane lipoprotein carrier protein LolA [Thermoanaerobaculia bacterium]
MRPKTLVPFALALALVAVAAIDVSSAQDAADPWKTLQGVRNSLVEAGATGAAFTQTYVPAGFTSGEQESGRLALNLPDCLRWDYQQPYPKSFLLCGGVAHSWNPEDKTGRRYRVDRKNEPGLDLLLLGVEDLKRRYNATSRPADGGRIQISLSPKQKVDALADAVLTVDPKSERLVEVSYHDREGNLTRFQINGYRSLTGQAAQFSPPRDIRWDES